MLPSSFVIITCCYPSSPIIHRCARASSLLRRAATSSLSLIRTAARRSGNFAAHRASRSRSVTIVRHHHPLFIIITPRAPQSDRQCSDWFGLIQRRSGSAESSWGQPWRRAAARHDSCFGCRPRLVSRVLFPALKRRGPETKRGWGGEPLRWLQLLAGLGLPSLSW